MSGERYQRGLERLKELDGPEVVDWVEEFVASNADLARYTVEYPYGDLWSRTGLTDREKEIAVIASLVTAGNAEEELASHISMSQKIGMTQQEVIEVIILMSAYAGFPVAIKALGIAKSVFKQQKSSEASKD